MVKLSTKENKLSDKNRIESPHIDELNKKSEL